MKFKMFPAPLILCKRAGFHFQRCSSSLGMGLLHSDSILQDLQIDFDLKHSYQKICLEEYPKVKKLQLPLSFRNLQSSEKTRFSRQQNRVVSVACISAAGSFSNKKINDEIIVNDMRTGNYDCLALINLSSTMQTSVPYPFLSENETTHLNMPGGPWRQEDKYISHELSSFHHINNIPCKFKMTGKHLLCSKTDTTQQSWNSILFQQKYFFSNEKKELEHIDENKSQICEPLKQNIQSMSRQRLIVAVKEYGAVIIVVHIAISLVSLGFWYIAVSSGISFQDLLQQWGMTEGSVAAGTAAPFVVAYAIHKLTAPARITITLTSVPFIVKFFRKKGFINKRK